MATRPDKPPAKQAPKRHNARGRQRRTALIDAAIEVVADHGIGGVTHRSVAARAGFPPSTTSYFFPSIDSLLMAAMTERIVRQVDRLKQLTAAIGSTELDRDQLADAFASVLAATPNSEMIAQCDLYLTAARRDDVRPHVEAMIHAFEDLAAAALEAFGAADPRTGARALVALIDGFALHRVALAQDPEAWAAELRDAFTTTFYAYAGSEEPTGDGPNLRLVK